MEDKDGLVEAIGIYLQKYIRGKAGYLILDNGVSVPVSRQKKDFLDEMG